MVANNAFKIKWMHMLRKVKKLTSDTCTDQKGEETPISKMVAVMRMTGEAQHPWTHRLEQGR